MSYGAQQYTVIANGKELYHGPEFREALYEFDYLFEQDKPVALMVDGETMLTHEQTRKQQRERIREGF